MIYYPAFQKFCLHNANVFQFTDNTNKLKEYIAINGNYYTPNYEGIVENQNSRWFISSRLHHYSS